MFEIKKIMSTKLITIKENTPAYIAVRLMAENSISGLPVVSEQKELIGIVSERDVLKLLYNTENDKQPVSQFMTKDVKFFYEYESAMDVCDFFLESYVKRVPILSRDKKLIGLVSRGDLIKFILKTRKWDKLPGLGTGSMTDSLFEEK